MISTTSGQADPRIRQVDLLYQHARLPQWLVFLGAVASSVLLWGHYHSGVLIAWTALMLLLTIGREILVRRYWQSHPVSRLLLRWRAMIYLGNIFTGVLLALVFIYMTPLDTFSLQGPVYGIAGGVSLCVGIIHANRFLAFLTLLLPTWLPTMTFLLTRDDASSHHWGVMAVAVFVFQIIAGAIINRSVQKTMAVNERNIALVASLEDTRRQAEELNGQLTREIKHRRHAENSLRESHDILEQRVSQRTAELEETTNALRASQDQLNLALEASELGLWDWKLDSDAVYDSRLKEIFGVVPGPNHTALRDLKPLVHPEDMPRVRARLIEHMKDQSVPFRAEYRVRHTAGHWVWVEDRGRAVERDANGRVMRMLGTRRDITTAKQQEEQAMLAATVFEATSEGIFILDPQLRILAVNQALTAITGYPAVELIGTFVHEMDGEAQDTENYRKIGEALRDGDRWQGERVATRRSGATYPQWLQMTVVRDDVGNITHYVGFFADLTVHRKTEERIRHLTNYDSLTQLPNRSLFTQRLNETIVRARRNDERVALLHVDLDRFKYINDTLGHSVADLLLQEVAIRLGDLSPEPESLARLSADEFVILVEQPASRYALTQLACKVLEVLKRPMMLGEHELVVTASIGISQFPETARDSLLIITQANLAMQHAKHLGGGGYQFFTQDLQAYGLERLQLENQLRKALDESQLVVHFQPKLHLDSDRITSAEALVRWQHPERGLIFPGDFIAMAEETGLIVALGDRVLSMACAQASLWHRQGPASVAVAVNLSVQQLRQEHFADRVREILEEHQLPAELLELELTESMLLEHLDVVTDNIAALDAMGIRLSVDDFGTGYSSLAYLKRFPLHALKIDRSFISGLEEGAQDMAIVRAIIAMAHSLGLTVVAEGVETEWQLEFLRSHGCDEVQGYLISRPTTAGAFAELLEKALDTSA